MQPQSLGEDRMSNTRWSNLVRSLPHGSVGISLVKTAGRVTECAYDTMVRRRLNEHMAPIAFGRDNGVTLSEYLCVLSAVRTPQNREL